MTERTKEPQFDSTGRLIVPKKDGAFDAALKAGKYTAEQMDGAIDFWIYLLKEADKAIPTEHQGDRKAFLKAFGDMDYFVALHNEYGKHPTMTFIAQHSSDIVEARKLCKANHR